MLHVKKLNAGYHDFQVLFDIEIEAKDREITAVIGPNGSGKSTLLKAIFGIATIHSGKIVYNEKDITKVPSYKKARMGLAYLPQIENIFVNLTVEENLKIAGYVLDDSSYQKNLGVALEIFLELKGLMKRKAGTLSGGERQFLAISTALIRKTELLMLDEPTAQLSPKLRETMFNRIASLRDDLGLSIILVEQDIRDTLEFSNTAYAIASGKVIFKGKAKQLLDHKDFERICMGVVQ